ncbi:TRAP transporter large permease subunit [Alcaligenes faecalis]|jgi:tripartite ATP-independent transporter DctM subunit|uniref:TRAP transporter large permease protein n=4 Tax=Alcaligenes TaxID=507 RepID=A0AAE9H6N2_ALCFA|nr:MULTISPECIES: TRAP transporter large permease subunit [Alcaligenes]KGP03648.1 C4-dicarboxylate ABC transporter permease [Alcaligenes faecalis]KVX06205.1 C4-dicarboxylate ABC transporter permease [Alcaligenes faecalis]MCM2558647.1 TRAP transporter large permease subunit [Alcaligenes faecalis]MCM2622720.1 TRAP transporter large permease subunit [Alcaligenes faecalis]MCX5473213.1 TRAP transporter large permease subunit [Alcaligenes nematophilus]
MADLSQAIVLFVVLLALLASGVWVALVLIACGILSIILYADAPAGIIFATKAWDSSASWALTALPLFIWMGEILYRTRLAEDMFSGLGPWVQRLPGRLVHVNTFGCGIFAAVSGSSAATAATIGRISLPELKARGYDDSISIGSLAGAGTLGLLIPPSIVMIVYAVAAQVSIIRLFVAGVLPGIMLMCLFSLYIAIWSLRHPDRVPADVETLTWGEKIRRLRLLLPVVLLIMAVIGSIYGGIATATEAAVLGVIGSLVIAAFGRSLNWKNFVESLLGAARTSCMISFILIGAAYLTSAMSFTGLPANLAAWIGSLGLSQYALIAVLTVFFIILGAFLDGISIVVLTTSVLLPAVIAAGIDPIWFGIYLILTVEMAQITPPIGFNLFVIQGITGRNLFELVRMAFPFFLVLVLATVIVTIFPQIVMVLPNAM